MMTSFHTDNDDIIPDNDDIVPDNGDIFPYTSVYT